MRRKVDTYRMFVILLFLFGVCADLAEPCVGDVRCLSQPIISYDLEASSRICCLNAESREDHDFFYCSQQPIELTEGPPLVRIVPSAYVQDHPIPLLSRILHYPIARSRAPTPLSV
jgi:hypothetical protein